MSIKNNKNICLVIYMEILGDKITLLYMYVFYSRNYCANKCCLDFQVCANVLILLEVDFTIELCCPQQLGKLF